jgi:two-component system response regulator ResD
MATIAIVDDDRTLSGVVASYLQRAGHHVLQAHDGVAGLDLISGQLPDLVLLDVMMPELDGIEVCRRIRAKYPQLPVVMLTALGEVDDRIAGLEVGADDYITKPFSPRELVLRVESVLRRSAESPSSVAVLRAGDLTLDPASHRATRDGAELGLTVREFGLLAFLLAHPGVAFSREQLMREVWGWSFGDQSTVTVHVRRLREKVEADPRNPTLVQTVYGVGYRLELPVPDPARSLS